MPVVTLYFDRIKKILGKNVQKKLIIDTLPFLGLDIEEETTDHINVEYSPNRPDYSTDYGIITGIQGLLGIKLGMPILKIKTGKNLIKADSSVSKVRPYITAIEARNGNLDDETIRQIAAKNNATNDIAIRVDVLNIFVSFPNGINGWIHQ